MTQLYLYDDGVARTFDPFSLTRPVSELRAGAELIRKRWEQRLGMTASGFIGAPHLAEFDEEGAPPALPNSAGLAAGSIIANSRFVVSLAGDSFERGARAWSCDGRVAAVRLSAEMRVADFADGKRSLDDIAGAKPAAGAGTKTVEGRWIEATWDLVATLSDQLKEDIPSLATRLTIHNAAGVQIIGEHPVFCERDALVEPWVVLDASLGPILIRTGAHVAAFSRLVGPCYIGERASVAGDRIASCSIGDVCKVRGEMSHTVVLAYSNKGHTGFVGHSYLGRWVNLGAGTTTSNLKNTYGGVRVSTDSGERDTGQQFLGTFFGDHAKTGIGTMLTTGTIIGAGANVFGAMQPPKRVPPFAWGAEPFERFELEKLLHVAGLMMARRHVTLSEKAKKGLRAAYAEACKQPTSRRKKKS